MLKLALPGPLTRLHDHGVLGVMIAVLLIMAVILLWVSGPMSPLDSNGRNR
jgi:hypothetical protein